MAMLLLRALGCLALWVAVECESFSGYDYGYRCPTNCTCTQEVATTVCKGSGSTIIPEGLPRTSSNLTLTNFNLSVLDLGQLSSLTRLKGLYLPSNKIRHIKGTLDVFENLSHVELKGNNLKEISAKLFGNITNLKRLEYVGLSGNPFNCDCGGIELNDDICNCTESNCTCNIKWLQEQVKLNKSKWGTRSVECQDSNSGPLGSESSTLPLSHKTPLWHIAMNVRTVSWPENIVFHYKTHDSFSTTTADTPENLILPQNSNEPAGNVR
ncbi:hypothetical protein Bbelb_312290 [Branchiostoma belcheri]|nr:hypothetical protein Bbelb_312290 [Branchiostoma belcheri]